MALTQLKTNVFADDSITASKIPANAVGTSEIADDAVTTDQLANAINTERTANTAKASITINTNADNRIITGSGTANTLNGEANLTYDGTTLNATGFLKTSAPVAWYGRQSTTEDSIADDTWTTVTNLTINPVTTTGWDGSTGIFTVPTGKGGTYFLTGGVGIDDVQSRDFCYIGFSKNDATPSPYQWGKQSYDSSNALVNVNMTILMDLADGDTVRMKTKHNEGTTENTEYAVTFFGGYRIT